MSKKNFKEGDLVAVVGGSVSKDRKIEKSAMIGKVVAVGCQDMFVESLSSYPYSTHKVSKNLCQKIRTEEKDLASESKNLVPNLGDLVLSYRKSGFGDSDVPIVTGVLYKITYTLGKADMCTILEATDFHHVKFNSLLLLQKEAS